jgi:hypothetical protein
MTLNDGVAWGTIIGGFAGFLSFGFVLADKLTTRPKLVTSVRKAVFRNEGGGPHGGDARVYLKVTLEIGNVGSEATTITRVLLNLPDGQTLETKDHKNISGGMTFIVDDYSTRVCEKGMAFIENLMFYSENGHTAAAHIDGALVLTLIGGREHRQTVIFKNEKN